MDDPVNAKQPFRTLRDEALSAKQQPSPTDSAETNQRLATSLHQMLGLFAHQQIDPSAADTAEDNASWSAAIGADEMLGGSPDFDAADEGRDDPLASKLSDYLGSNGGRAAFETAGDDSIQPETGQSQASEPAQSTGNVDWLDGASAGNGSSHSSNVFGGPSNGQDPSASASFGGSPTMPGGSPRGNARPSASARVDSWATSTSAPDDSSQGSTDSEADDGSGSSNIGNGQSIDANRVEVALAASELEQIMSAAEQRAVALDEEIEPHDASPPTAALQDLASRLNVLERSFEEMRLREFERAAQRRALFR